MTRVVEGTLAHASAIVTANNVVIWLSPAEGLRGCQHCRLLLLVVVAELSVLAPARLVLALGAVVRSVCSIIFHLKDVIETARVDLGLLEILRGCGDFVSVSEVVNIRVSLGQLSFHGLNFSHGCVLRLSSFFL